MTKHGLDACGGGGWTLVTKIDGTKVLEVKCSHKQLSLSVTFTLSIKVNIQGKTGSSKCRFDNR